MVEKRQNRSDKYQHLLLETQCANEMLESFSNQDSIYFKLNPWAYNDEVIDLEERLREKFWELIGKLTPRQREVIELYTKGSQTQTEIAKKLNVNQSSITKSINGNVDYKNGKKCYGGAKRKIAKMAEEDPEIQAILARLRELRETIW